MKALDSVGTATGVALGPHSEQADIIADRFRELIDENNCQKAEIERLKKNIDGLNIFTTNHMKVIRVQAIKEFAERLKSRLANLSVQTKTHGRKTTPNYVDDIANQILHDVVPQEIDNLVKEMTEVQE